MAAYFGCFASVESEKIAYIFGGGKFADATVPLMIMSIYPIYQTYGQLTGALLYATARTKLYRNIGVAFMLLGLPLAYFYAGTSRKVWGGFRGRWLVN